MGLLLCHLSLYESRNVLHCLAAKSVIKYTVESTVVVCIHIHSVDAHLKSPPENIDNYIL